jgi:molybdenum cofactor cytidylyltransferase
MIRACAVVPAAGKGERFGASTGLGVTRAKLLADVNGEPLLSRTIRCLLDAGVHEVVVVLAGRSPVPPRTDHSADPPSGRLINSTSVPILADPRVRVAINPDPARGMFSSIQAGMAAAAGDPVLILPGDMPFVTRETVAAVLAACQRTGQVVSPRCEGRRGHPIALPGRLREPIAAADPAATLSALLTAHCGARLDLDVADRGILRDVDVIGDLTP